MFIVRALEKILADKDIKRQGQLKKSCESAIATLKGCMIFHSLNLDFLLICEPENLLRTRCVLKHSLLTNF
jgi:hypothetical protein